MLLSFWNYNSIQFEGVYHNYQTESKTFGEKILVQCIDLKHTTVQSILFIHESLVWIHTSSIYDHLVTVQCYDRHTHTKATYDPVLKLESLQCPCCHLPIQPTAGMLQCSLSAISPYPSSCPTGSSQALGQLLPLGPCGTWAAKQRCCAHTLPYAEVTFSNHFQKHM